MIRLFYEGLMEDAMKNKRIILAFMMLLMITGCGRIKELNNEETIDYLCERYDRQFEFVASETRLRSDYDYIDTDMKKENFSEESSDIVPDEIRILTAKDENGVEFHVSYIEQFGIIGWMDMRDDYCIQWLKSQPELYAPLVNSEYECDYFNEIGYKEYPDAGFILHVDNFYEIQPAIELAYSVIENEAAIVPDGGCDRDDIAAYAIRPSIVIRTTNGIQIESVYEDMYFSTQEKKLNQPLEEYITGYSLAYVDLVRDGVIEEQLSEDVLKEYGPEEINTVTFDGEDTGLFFNRDSSSSDSNLTREKGKTLYYIYDNSYDDFNFLKIAKLASYAGYSIEIISEDETRFFNGTESIIFKRDKKNYYIIRNDEVMKIKGSFRYRQIVLTMDDLYTLFGIKVELDLINGTAELSSVTMKK